MGRVFVIEHEGPFVYTCIECNAHLGLPNDIISKQQIGEDLIAYVFSTLFNTFVAESTDYPGSQDIFCVGCNNTIGAYSPSDEEGPYWVLRYNTGLTNAPLENLDMIQGADYVGKIVEVVLTVTSEKMQVEAFKMGQQG